MLRGTRTGFAPDRAEPLTMTVGPVATLAGFDGACGVFCDDANVEGFGTGTFRWFCLFTAPEDHKNNEQHS